MDKEQKQQWIEALKSRKYKQGEGLLYDYNLDIYCCLGVAQKLFNLYEEEDGQYVHTDFLGMNIQCDLVNMNDRGCSFTKIADYIDKNIEPTE